MTSRAAWRNAIAAIEEHDRHTRGIVVLGLDAPEAELAASFETAASFDLVKGFAVGRTIFGEVARGWMTGAHRPTPRRSPRWPAATRGSARSGTRREPPRGRWWREGHQGRGTNERNHPADRGAGDDALAERADDRGRRALHRGRLGDLRPRQRRRHRRGAAPASATRCRPGAARTSRPWPTPPSPTPRRSAAAAPMPSPLRSAPARPTWSPPRRSPTSTACRCCSSAATSSPTAGPTRCCSRSRTSTTARSRPTTASSPSPATSTASRAPSTS